MFTPSDYEKNRGS